MNAGRLVGPAEDGLTDGVKVAATTPLPPPPPLLLEDGEEGAEPAEDVRKERSGARVENLSFSPARDVKEPVGFLGSGERVGAGEEEVGESVNTGTDEKCSTGILILSEQRVHTC